MSAQTTTESPSRLATMRNIASDASARVKSTVCYTYDRVKDSWKLFGVTLPTRVVVFVFHVYYMLAQAILIFTFKPVSVLAGCHLQFPCSAPN